MSEQMAIEVELVGWEWESVWRKEKEIWEVQYSRWFAREEEETEAIFIIVATIIHAPGLTPKFVQPGKENIYIYSWKLQNLRLTYDLNYLIKKS